MKILVVYYGHKGTFIQRDLAVLSKYFEVEEFNILYFKDIFSLCEKIKKVDIVYVWFAGKHAGISVFLSKIFRTKSILVLGGYDVARFPEFNYGLWANGGFLDKFLAKYAIKNADMLISVSDYVSKQLQNIIKSKIQTVNIYLGVEDDYCEGGQEDTRSQTVLTVGYITDMRRAQIKGIDNFVHAARRLPNVTFKVVGVPDEIGVELKKIMEIPDNVELISPQDGIALKAEYNHARVYCQLSYIESFGVAVVEAMQCGCVPVVTNRGALPEVVGETGIIVEYGNIDAMVNGIKRALEQSMDEEFVKLVVNRGKQFSLTRRARELVKLIENH